MTGSASWPLVGRAEELDLLDATVTDSSGSFVVAGPAGVGKSRLASEFLRCAAETGLSTLTVRATRSMATIPFGAFARWTPGASTSPTSDRLHVLRATCATIVGSHERIVVSIDDAHLLDEGSAALASHLAADRRVSIVATIRSGEPCPDAVAALWKDGLAERVDLQPLSESETTALLEQVLGGPLDQSARHRVWALTEGVPLYLREVVRAAEQQAVLVEENGRWLWRGSLSGSDRLHELIADHLGQLDAEERRFVELLAFGEPLALDVIDELDLRSPLTTAERQGVVVVDDDERDEPVAPRVRLCHPLYSEVLRAQVPSVRARAHRSALVRAALALGLQQRDPLVVAEWSLKSDVALDPDDALAAARQALALSKWGLAEKLTDAATAEDGDARAILVRAVAVSPQARWDETLWMLAALAIASLDDETGLEVADEAVRIHAWMLFWGPGGRASLDDVFAATERLPAAIRPLAFAHCSFQAVLVARPDDAVVLARLVLGDGPLDGTDPPDAVRVQALSALAFARGMQGRTGDAIEAAELGLPHVAGILADDPVPGNPAGAMPVAFCLALVLDGRIEEAATVARFIHDGQSEARALQALAGALAARMELYTGRVGSARELAEEALSVCRETGQLPASHWPASTFASAAAQLGDPQPGEQALRWSLDSSPIGPLYNFEARQAQAWLQAAQGRLSAARAQALDTADAAAKAGLHTFALLSLLDLARFGGVREADERLSAVAPKIDGAFSEAVAAYVRAAADTDAEALSEMSCRFEEMGALLLAAEAAATEATAHQAAGRQSSEAAAEGRARVLAARCGDPVTPALRGLSGDPVLALLTDREREVVELAARGLTNREIADQLFVSVRTVNTHLYRSYGKLGVNDRAQLAPLVLADDEGAPGK